MRHAGKCVRAHAHCAGKRGISGTGTVPGLADGLQNIMQAGQRALAHAQEHHIYSIIPGRAEDLQNMRQTGQRARAHAQKDH
jgi:hypothetical protein